MWRRWRKRRGGRAIFRPSANGDVRQTGGRRSSGGGRWRRPARCHRSSPANSQRASWPSCGWSPTRCGTKRHCTLTLGGARGPRGVGVTTARNALHEAAGHGYLTIEERRRDKRPNLSNVVRVVSREWLVWIARGPKNSSAGRGNADASASQRGGSKKMESTDKGSNRTYHGDRVSRGQLPKTSSKNRKQRLLEEVYRRGSAAKRLFDEVGRREPFEISNGAQRLEWFVVVCVNANEPSLGLILSQASSSVYRITSAMVFPICRAGFSAVAEIVCPPTSVPAAFGAPPMEAGSAEPSADLDGFPACELASRSATSALSESRVRKPGSSRRNHSPRRFENSTSPAFSNRCRTSAPSRTFRLVSLARSCFPCGLEAPFLRVELSNSFGNAFAGHEPLFPEMFRECSYP